MKNGILDRKTYYYLPWRGTWVISLTFGAAELVNLGHYIFAVVTVFLAALSLTAHYGIRVDTQQKTWFDYVSVLGFKRGETKPYSTVDYVFIKSSMMSQTMNSMVTSRTDRVKTYDAYIKFDGHEKIYLLSDEKKKRVGALLLEMAAALSVQLVDYTIEPNTAQD